jgi:hypothetical protein
MTSASPELHELIEFRSQKCEAIFQETGKLHGMYHAILESGESIVIPPPPCDDKDTAARMIRQFFREAGVVRYVLVCEAWILAKSDGISDDDMEQCQRLGVSSHPQRRKAVMFVGEDSNWTVFARRTIERPEGRAAYLGPLVFEQLITASGRMASLLPKRKPSS